MTFIRKRKVNGTVYLAEVKSVREGKKVKQQFIRYLGKSVEGTVERKVSTADMQLQSVKHHLDILTIKSLLDSLDLPPDLDKSALALVFSQLLEKKSINTLEEWFEHTNIAQILDTNLSTKSLYLSLNKLGTTNFTLVENAISHSLRKIQTEHSAAVIDVTDTYFEDKNVEGKKIRGKDGKVRKLVQVALAVTLEQGFPLFHKTYR